MIFYKGVFNVLTFIIFFIGTFYIERKLYKYKNKIKSMILFLYFKAMNSILTQEMLVMGHVQFS
jgi:hypothetical protein